MFTYHIFVPVKYHYHTILIIHFLSISYKIVRHSSIVLELK